MNAGLEWSVLGRHLRAPIRNGYSPVCPSKPTGAWMLSLSAVTEDGFDPTGVKPAPANDPRVAENLLESGDIVVSRSNTPERVGLAGLYRGHPAPCAYPDLLMRVRPSATLEPDFLLAQLLSGFGRRFFADTARGSSSSMVKIDKAILESFPVWVPPVPEQRAIAAALSDVDALIAALDQLIAKKRDLKTATMQQLLTGQRRLPGFTGAWETKRLGDLFTFLRTAHNPRADLTALGEVGYVHYGDIHTSASAFLDVTIRALPRIRGALVTGANFVEDGDLIMADASEDYDGIGKCVEVSGTAALKVVAGLHTFLLRGDKQQLADGFKGYMQAIPTIRSSLVRLATGISVYGVSKNNVKTIEVALPSVKEQQAIAHVLRDMDAELEALEERRDKTKLIKQGMMQELLTGRTRLVAATT